MIRAVEDTGGLRRWIISLVLFGLVLAATFLAVTAFFPGDTYLDSLEAAYVVLWTNTTQEQFTDIMRENLWLYVIPAGGIVFLSGWQLPRKFWANWVGTAPPITELLRLVCAIPPAEPDVQLSPHPALHQMS